MTLCSNCQEDDVTICRCMVLKRRELTASKILCVRDELFHEIRDAAHVVFDRDTKSGEYTIEQIIDEAFAEFKAHMTDTRTYESLTMRIARHFGERCHRCRSEETGHVDRDFGPVRGAHL